MRKEKLVVSKKIFQQKFFKTQETPTLPRRIKASTPKWTQQS